MGMKYTLAMAAFLGLFSNDEVNAIRIEKDLFHELHLRDIGGVTQTWARGTTNMVDDQAKVADIGRKMDNNPSRSRKEWKETRDASIAESAK